MVSDINIQRWISIGADPVHRLTLNGKAPLKKRRSVRLPCVLVASGLRCPCALAFYASLPFWLAARALVATALAAVVRRHPAVAFQRFVFVTVAFVIGGVPVVIAGGRSGNSLSPACSAAAAPSVVRSDMRASHACCACVRARRFKTNVVQPTTGQPGNSTTLRSCSSTCGQKACACVSCMLRVCSGKRLHLSWSSSPLPPLSSSSPAI